MTRLQADLLRFLLIHGVLFLTLGFDASAQAPADVVARINGKSVTVAEVDRAVDSEVFALQQQLYALRKTALDNLILHRLLESEAATRHVSLAELRKQWTAFQIQVPPEKVEQVYAENAKAFESMSPDEAMERLRMDMESQERIQKYREALAKLKETARIEIYLEEPRFPPINIAKAPSKGSDNAPVELVEFSDFQCPFCRSSQATLRELLKAYPQEVRLVYKHRPLEIHSDAFAAAQGAYCAQQQTAFWNYHDALFAADDLSVQSLHKLAAQATLNLTQFDSCFNSDVSHQAVQDDLDEARRLGINSTPTFVINGRVMRGALTLEEFKAAIDKELQSAKRTNP